RAPTPGHVTSSVEPPGAVPHARWCGRGSPGRPGAPIPIKCETGCGGLSQSAAAEAEQAEPGEQPPRRGGAWRRIARAATFVAGQALVTGAEIVAGSGVVFAAGLAGLGLGLGLGRDLGVADPDRNRVRLDHVAGPVLG